MAHPKEKKSMSRWHGLYMSPCGLIMTSIITNEYSLIHHWVDGVPTTRPLPSPGFPPPQKPLLGLFGISFLLPILWRLTNPGHGLFGVPQTHEAHFLFRAFAVTDPSTWWALPADRGASNPFPSGLSLNVTSSEAFPDTSHPLPHHLFHFF